MALAETAVLAVELKLAGASQFKAGISEADAAAAGLGKSVTSAGTAVTSTGSVFSQFGGKMGFVKQAVVSTGQAISGMASHFKNVITGPLGLIGLGAGLFTVAGAIKSGIDEAQSFGLEVQKLAALTGQSVEATSAMAAALDHFGISGDAAIKTVGMLTKNIGMIVNAKGGTQKFFTEYGLQLRDVKGNLVSVNEEILRTADYFNNKSIPATEKAAGIAKLYGRSWQQLIPFLQAGRKGITEAEQAAQDLGLTLTAQNVGDLKTYRESFLKLGDAVKGAELQIGLVLMPALSGLATSVTNFLAHGGRQTLVTFFQNALQTAKDFGAFVSGTVIPTIKGLASAALGLWNSIPAPLRDILAKGFIADRTIHFLFGVSPIHLATSLLGDVAGPIIKTLIANRLIPQPVVIVGGMPGVPGVPGGLPSAVPEAAAGLGLTGLAQLATLAAVPLIPLVATYFLAGGASGIATKDYAGRQATAAARGLNPAFVPVTTQNGMQSPIAAWAAGRNQATRSGGTAVTGAVHDAETSAAIGQLTHSAAELRQAAKEEKANAAAQHAAAVATSKIGGSILAAGASRDKQMSAAITSAIRAASAAVTARANTILSTAARHDAETSNSIKNAIASMKPPSVAVAISIGGVALSQTVIHRHATVHRYGPTGGTRNTSLRQSESFG